MSHGPTSATGPGRSGDPGQDRPARMRRTDSDSGVTTQIRVTRIRVTRIRVTRLRVTRIRVTRIRVTRIRVARIRVTRIRVTRIRGTRIQVRGLAEARASSIRAGEGEAMRGPIPPS